MNVQLVVRLRRNAWVALLQVPLFIAGMLITRVVPVYAGHSFSGGDCWRGGTPTVCRASWPSGNQHEIHLKIINQLSDTTLWNSAMKACANWNSSPGPVYCQTTAFTNDSWVYFKRNDGIGAPNGITWNCITNACPFTEPNSAQWSEIYVPIGNNNYGGISISVDGHETGHSLGLDHHGTIGSNAALMTQGTNLQAPNNLDLGPVPACATNPVGSNGTGGVRCIYNSLN